MNAAHPPFALAENENWQRLVCKNGVYNLSATPTRGQIKTGKTHNQYTLHYSKVDYVFVCLFSPAAGQTAHVPPYWPFCSLGDPSACSENWNLLEPT